MHIMEIKKTALKLSIPLRNGNPCGCGVHLRPEVSKLIDLRPSSESEVIIGLEFFCFVWNKRRIVVVRFVQAAEHRHG